MLREKLTYSAVFSALNGVSLFIASVNRLVIISELFAALS